jgi:dTDP-glucose pyrophosphorylase
MSAILKKFQVSSSSTIKEAVSYMDSSGHGFCVCVDPFDRVIGVISDGDFRRAILNDIDLNRNIEEIVNKDFIQIKIGYKNEDLSHIFLKTIARAVPVLNDKGVLQDIIFKDNFFSGQERSIVKKKLAYPVVIMAGGEGTRMAPFTNILPKPLLPLGDDPVIKVIMDKFSVGGVDEFYITVNSKKQMIKGYFHDHKSPYKIHFIDENEPLGTAGSLGLFKKNIDTSFFVVNCDVVLDIDYSDLVEFHNTGGFDLTLVASLKHYTIPYGVCDIDNQGLLVSMHEKPEQDLLVNTGLYFLNSNVLDLISGRDFLHMTDIIQILKEKGFKVGVYPVTDKSWLDVGQWEEYSETLKQLNLKL